MWLDKSFNYLVTFNFLNIINLSVISKDNYGEAEMRLRLAITPNLVTRQEVYLVRREGWCVGGSVFTSYLCTIHFSAWSKYYGGVSEWKLDRVDIGLWILANMTYLWVKTCTSNLVNLQDCYFSKFLLNGHYNVFVTLSLRGTVFATTLWHCLF